MRVGAGELCLTLRKPGVFTGHTSPGRRNFLDSKSYRNESQYQLNSPYNSHCNSSEFVPESAQIVFKDRKSQQQTLSIRVSESVRAFLDRARAQFSDTRGEALSISDVAKLLLEGAIESRLDDRLETADLLADPTAALLGIRRKWEANQQLTRAEWTVLGQYVQGGCDNPSSDPELPSRESFAQLLEALLAVRALRLHHSADLDHYYLGNLSGWTEQGEKILTAGQQGADIVPAVVRRMIDDLRNAPAVARPPFAGRNIYVAVRDERLEGADSLNRVLLPFLPVLYRVAARGHWLVEHRPIREERKPWETPSVFPQHVPDIKVDDIRVACSLGTTANFTCCSASEHTEFPIPWVLIRTSASSRIWCNARAGEDLERSVFLRPHRHGCALHQRHSSVASMARAC